MRRFDFFPSASPLIFRCPKGSGSASTPHTARPGSSVARSSISDPRTPCNPILYGIGISVGPSSLSPVRHTPDIRSSVKFLAIDRRFRWRQHRLEVHTPLGYPWEFSPRWVFPWGVFQYGPVVAEHDQRRNTQFTDPCLKCYDLFRSTGHAPPITVASVKPFPMCTPDPVLNSVSFVFFFRTRGVGARFTVTVPRISESRQSRGPSFDSTRYFTASCVQIMAVMVPRASRFVGLKRTLSPSWYLNFMVSLLWFRVTSCEPLSFSLLITDATKLELDSGFMHV